MVDATVEETELVSGALHLSVNIVGPIATTTHVQSLDAAS